MPDCIFEKKKEIKFATIDVKDNLPSFVEVVRMLGKLENRIEELEIITEVINNRSWLK